MCRKNKSATLAWTRSIVAGLLGTTLLLSGCGSPIRQQNARFQQAIQSNQLGESAYYAGDYARALIYFEEALRIDQSIENVDGIAMNRINLARTSIAMGDTGQARRHLDALLKTPLLPYSAAHLAQAAVLESTLFVANGNLAAAFDLVEKGQAWCANSCAALPSLLLLRAQIALRSQRPDEAIEHASNVLRRLDGTQLIEEKANALRVIGEALLEKNNPVESIPRFEQALALDREAGATQKIGIDLMYLGQASNLVNKHGDANTYFRRAAAVRTASGDKVGGEAAARNIEPKE